MVNRAILEAQLGQYKKGKEQTVMAFNKAQADLYMFDGAIEACNTLLAIEKAMEDHEIAEKKAAEACNTLLAIEKAMEDHEIAEKKAAEEAAITENKKTEVS